MAGYRFSFSMIQAILSFLLAREAHAQCSVSGYSDDCNTTLGQVCFASTTYDPCVNNLGSSCSDFNQALNAICNYGTALQSCASSGTGDSSEDEIVQAWVATCATFAQSNDYGAAYTCWQAGGGSTSCAQSNSGGSPPVSSQVMYSPTPSASYMIPSNTPGSMPVAPQPGSTSSNEGSYSTIGFNMVAMVAVALFGMYMG